MEIRGVCYENDCTVTLDALEGICYVNDRRVASWADGDTDDEPARVEITVEWSEKP